MSERLALIQGAMYRVRVQIPGVFRVPRESCMKLIGTSDNGETLIFSARPRLGTQEVQMRHVTEIEIQPPDAKVYVSWKVNSKRPPVKWNYQR
jgi:hypothetical protein